MTYKVTVTVENPDGISTTHITEYDELPTLLAIEDGLDVELDMSREYKYWQEDRKSVV